MKKKMPVFNFHLFIDHLDGLANFCRSFLQESSFNPNRQSLSSACQQSTTQAQDFLRQSFVIRGKFLKRIFPNQGQDMSFFLMKLREENMAIFELISDEIDNEDKKFVMSTNKLCDDKLKKLVKLAEPIIDQFPHADAHLKRAYLEQAIKSTHRHGGMREEQWDLLNFLRELPTIMSALLICAQHHMELFFKLKSTQQPATGAYEKLLRFYNAAYDIGVFALNHASSQDGDINWSFFPFMVGMNAVESLNLCLKRYPEVIQDPNLNRFMPHVEKYVRKYTCAEVNHRQKSRLILPLAMIYLQLGDIDKSNSLIKKLLQPIEQPQSVGGLYPKQDYLDGVYKLFDYAARLGLLQNYILFSSETIDKISDKNKKSRLMRNLNHIIIEARQLLDHFDVHTHFVMDKLEHMNIDLPQLQSERLQSHLEHISVFDPNICMGRLSEWFYVNHVTYMLSLIQLSTQIPESELNFMIVQELLISFYKINKAIFSLDNGIVHEPFRGELKTAYIEVIRNNLFALSRVDFSNQLVVELNQLSAKIDYELDRMKLTSDQLFIELFFQYDKSTEKSSLDQQNNRVSQDNQNNQDNQDDQDDQDKCEPTDHLANKPESPKDDGFKYATEKARNAWLKHDYKTAEFFFAQARKSLGERLEPLRRSKLHFSWGVMLYCQAESELKRFSSLVLELNIGTEYFKAIQRVTDANQDNYHSSQIAKELSSLTPRVEKLTQLLARSLANLHEAMRLLMRDRQAIKNIEQAQEILGEYIQQTKEALLTLEALPGHIDEWYAARGHFIRRFHFDKKSKDLEPQATHKHQQVGQVIQAFKEIYTSDAKPFFHLNHMQSLISVQSQGLMLISVLSEIPEKSLLLPVLSEAIEILTPLIVDHHVHDFFKLLHLYVQHPEQAMESLTKSLKNLMSCSTGSDHVTKAINVLCYALELDALVQDTSLYRDLDLLRKQSLQYWADFKHVPALQALQVWLTIFGWQLTRFVVHQHCRVFTHAELLQDVTPIGTSFEQRLFGHVRLGLAYAGVMPLDKMASDRGFAVTMFNWVQAQSAHSLNAHTKALVDFSIFCLNSMPVTESSYGLFVCANN